MKQSNLLPLAAADCKKPPSNATAYDPTPNLFQNTGCATRDAIFAAGGWENPDFDNDQMTDASCSATCTGFAYFAVAFGRDCWCGNNAPAVLGDQSECTYPNSGASEQIGGSDTAMSVFDNTPAPVETGPGGSTNTSTGTYLGCFQAESNEDPPRPLFETYDFTPVPSNLTTQESCASDCAAFKYFALQNGDTCRCDNSIPFGNVVDAGEDACDIRAAGNSLEAGGGADALTAFYNPLYQVRPSLLTQCSKLCSANMKTYDPG